MIHSVNTIQPFLGVLLDNTSEGKRTNLFAAPVHKELLGTLGLDYDVTIKDFSFGLEMARNFGAAQSDSADFKDVEHKGYLIYLNSSYKAGKFTPYCQLLYSSGNKVTTEMVNNGDTQFVSGANKAFSVYSPLNLNLFDSHSPGVDSAPLVFLGWGYGISYGVGINRPSTLADISVLDNLIMPSLGFDYDFTEKFSAGLNWWYISSNERGVGTFGGAAIELSRDLGQEIDASFSYKVNKNLNFSLDTGYFIPGAYFREKRDDTGGSLFTPFVRGDGSADPAYQVEFITEFNF